MTVENTPKLLSCLAASTLAFLLAACTPSEEAAVGYVEPGVEAPLSISDAAPGRFPEVSIANVFEPPGESNVRSSFRLAENVALIGTEETGDVFKSSDGGETWTKQIDGGDLWGLDDVRNYLRADDGNLYITTSEPALVCRSEDEGASWEVLARPQSSRTVGIVQLDNGDLLVGLRRAEQLQTSIVRSDNYFESFEWVPVSDEKPPQNTTCFHNLGGPNVLVGVGYEASGKIYKSTDHGRTWEKKADYPEARDMMWFFESDGKVYLLASGVATLYVSDDEGESWRKHRQFWEKGFLGMAQSYQKGGKDYLLLTATDQTKKPYRHVVLISDDQTKTWYEWIELDQDVTGGASNLAVLSETRIVAGTGNHSAQGKAFTLQVE
ncbi:sialidase family protein [Pelagicoccus sp. SDUM812005]|uniref:sialidase family protein n=1 Tax=Pelagicoccus sp. SDUM812005 TaxID=3041257 RepID=UPI00280C6B9F|nr:sialidase family protein [Pelagicoccus sp. SDUM812005]MDQ8181567.1 sialidase family protein [Pelagicoccus sp. SDUM812005]